MGSAIKSESAAVKSDIRRNFMDKDTISKAEFYDPALNFLNNFRVFFYYLINGMINKDNEEGVFFGEISASTMSTEYNRHRNFNPVINVFPIGKKRVKYKTIW